MFQKLSIKAKLLATVICSIVVLSMILLFESVTLLKKESKEIIKDSTNSAYATKEKELENYVSLAYKTVESYYARTAKDKIKEEVKTYIIEQSDYLFSIINNIYEKNKDVLPEMELKNRIKAIVEATRYGQAGYFWINDFDYKMVMHPIKKELSGKYFKDTPKVPFVQLGVDALKANGKDKAFIEYSFYSPKSKKTMYKSSIVRVFKPYNWILGTGAYIDDVTEKMKKEALEAVANMKYGKTGYFWINNSNYEVLSHGAKPSLVGKQLGDLKDKKGTFIYKAIVKVANAKKEGGIVKYFWTIPGKKGDYEKIAYVRNFKPWDFVIGTGAYTIEIEEIADKLHKNTESIVSSSITQAIIAVLIILVIITLIVMFMLKKIIFNPLNRFQDGLLSFFKYINKEQKDIQLLGFKTEDEIAKMANIIDDNIEKTKSIIEQDNTLIHNVKEVVNKVSQGYLDDRIKSNTNNESLEELKSLLNNMLDNLQQLVGTNINVLNDVLEHYANKDFTKTLDSTSSGKIGMDIINMNKMLTKILQDNQEDGILLQDKSTELTTNVETLNENATSQAASLEETAASIEEITSNIRQTNEKAQEMLQISTKTQNSAQTGKDLAAKTVSSMDEINDTVININEAITVIDQIAFQTNILSLNAAVEAATAGEAGKGFAVVAQEVRNLAARSADAAKEIKELVETATIKANEGKEISTSMIQGFNELDENITHTNDLINDVSNAAKEQNIGMTQISDAINQLDKFTQENASIADKTNEIAKETNEIAKEIVDNVKSNNFDGKKD